jgi:hypothetical protein
LAPPSLLYPVGTGSHYPGAKLLEHEADHSPTSAVEVKKCGAIILLPQDIFTATSYLSPLLTGNAVSV